MELNYINTHTIGDIGEAIAIAEFTKAGLAVSIPLTANLPYDLLVDYKGNIYKVQVKTTEKIKDENIMSFHTVRTNGYTYNKVAYTKDEIDLFFLYCIENNWCGLANVNDITVKELNIRLESPTHVNQYEIYLAQDYEFVKQIEALKTGVPVKKTIINITDYKKTKVTKTVIPGRTDRNKLKNEIRSMPFLQIAKQYGVSDNSIRKWCESMGLPASASLIKTISDEDWENI